MLSYGEVSLLSAPPAGLILPPAEAFSGFFRPRWTGKGLNPRIHFNWFLKRPIRLNSYYDPWGASRWSTAYVLTHQAGLDDIRELVYGDEGDEYNALEFKIDDNAGAITGQTTSTLETDLYMLPAMPLAAPALSDTDPGQQIYLLVLVDSRYFFWEKAATISITEGTTTWAQLYASIATALGITITVDTIPAAYLKPSAALEANYDYLPLLLDWVAASVGQRVVRRLDGTFKALNATSALTLQAEQVDAYIKLAGGALDVGVLS